MLTTLNRPYFTAMHTSTHKKTCVHFLLFILTGILLSGCTTTLSTLDGNPASINLENVESFTQAISAMKAGNQNKAKSLLIELINKQPNISNAHVNLAIIFLNEKSLYEAESSLNKALKINPENIYALNQIGILYRQQGRFSDSKTAYKKAININSDYALAHLNLGILYDLYMYNLVKAIEHYKKYQEITKETDAKVNKWIVDLERRHKNSLAQK